MLLHHVIRIWSVNAQQKSSFNVEILCALLGHGLFDLIE